MHYGCKMVNNLAEILCYVTVFPLFCMLIAFLKRNENRLRIYRFLGFVPADLDTMAERLQRDNFKPAVIWENVILFSWLHFVSIFAIYFLTFFGKWQTFFWSMSIHFASLFSVTAGAHMLWSHRSYKAGLPLRLLLIGLQSMSQSNSIIHWSRDHRVHHKFCDLDADHTNRQRGWFFSHWGWLLVEKHPQVIREGRKLDITDLTSDPLLAAQRKYLPLFYLVFGWIIPILIPIALWNECPWLAAHTCVTLPWTLTINSVAVVNSWFHSSGTRPYTKKSSATDGSFLRHLFSLGAGDHNFHHAYPQDYSQSGSNSPLLITKHLIDLCCVLGLAWGRKQAKKKEEVIELDY